MGEEKKGFFRRLVSGLTKTRDNIVSGMDSIFHGFSRIDDDFYEELEETLIMGDLGSTGDYGYHRRSERKSKRTAYKRAVGMQAASDRQYPGSRWM